MFLDIILEQIFQRLILQEALLVSPLLGTFVVTEFIMTMGAEDLRAFINSYLIESTIVMLTRIYIGPFIEYLELLTQQTLIKLSRRFQFVASCCERTLSKQLAAQIKLMSLNEFKQKKNEREDHDRAQEIKDGKIPKQRV